MYGNLLAEMGRMRISQNELAKKMKISATTLSKKMRGKVGFTLNEATSISNIFLKDIEYLFESNANFKKMKSKEQE